MADDVLERVRLLLGGKPKKPVHKLKWKLPEMRLSIPVPDAEDAVLKLKKSGATYVSGGEYVDTVYAKPYGEGVFSYFFVRIEKKTENEHLLFDGYMIQEEEPLGVNLTSSFSIMEDLESLGYQKTLVRDLTEWRLRMAFIRAAVFDVTGFGSFIELALPATNFADAREKQQKKADDVLKKLGIKHDEALPTDVVTLQWLSQQQEKGSRE
ncbi:MAG TPA: hypothetical protein VI874_03300 [Candidatus Norongarragalinales archaeon]|nr:hypothetical protein [Candidatus Norongarragalinales archaeon]